MKFEGGDEMLIGFRLIVLSWDLGLCFIVSWPLSTITVFALLSQPYPHFPILLSHHHLNVALLRSLPAQPNRDLAQKIAAHNRSLRKKEFDAQTWDCGICLDAKKGRFCVRFDGEQEGQDEGEGCGCVL
jgi:hypothetical protein